MSFIRGDKSELFPPVLPNAGRGLTTILGVFINTEVVCHIQEEGTYEQKYQNREGRRKWKSGQGRQTGKH